MDRSKYLWQANIGQGRCAWSLSLVLLSAALLAVGPGCNRDQASQDELSKPATPVVTSNPGLPAIPDSPFLNVKDGEYVGNDRCIECHAGEHENYIHTGMGRSLADIDLEQEPPEGEVDHPMSQRRYRIYHKNGEMVHQEIMVTDGVEQVLADNVVRYVIGSGNHARSYLVELDGFLFESPVTWFPAFKRWGISPGYDDPKQPGFTRGVGQKCLSCHVGQSAVIDGSVNKMVISEQWISCERCHGPGSLHVKKHADGSGGNSGLVFDNTIVNPAHLSRELSEDLCAQCHQGFPAMAYVRGRKQEDFRPGLPLSSFRLDYRLNSQNSQMTVVGHMEQMKRSTCYENSEMTCATCHNPHDFPPRGDPVAYHKRNCLKCHAEERCTVDPVVQETTRSDNYCVACHMPSTGTESPHLTFTHHKIGIHVEGDNQPGGDDGQAPDLLPRADLSGYSELDQQFGKGVAYYNLSNHSLAGRHGEAYLAKGGHLLRQAWGKGLRDGELAALLAELSLFGGNSDFEMYADYALADKELAADHRVGVLLVKVSAHYQRQEFGEAATLMKQVAEMRRRTGDWDLLGKYLYQSGQREEAKKAFQKSLEIDPANRPVRLMLEQFNR
jgi:hypothetical protein